MYIIGLMFDAIQLGAPRGEDSWESREVWGAARLPDGWGGQGRRTGNGFWEMVPSWGMVKVGLI